MPGSAFPRFFLLSIVVLVRNVPLRMTGRSMANGCDMTGSDVTGSNVIFPRFFLSIELVQNVSLCMIGSSMATGCDVTKSDVMGSDVTRSDVIRPKVGDSPWGVILFVRGFV